MLRSIVKMLLADVPAIPPDEAQDVEDRAVGFVAAALSSAPAHIRSSERLARVVFWLCLRLGISVATFERLAPPCADLVRVYRSLAVFACFEQPGMARALGGEAAEDRHLRFRNERKRAIAAAKGGEA